MRFAACWTSSSVITRRTLARHQVDRRPAAALAAGDLAQPSERGEDLVDLVALDARDDQVVRGLAQRRRHLEQQRADEVREDGGCRGAALADVAARHLQ